MPDGHLGQDASRHSDALRPTTSGQSEGLGERRGAFVAVVGPSGAGKDTVLSLSRQLLSGDPAIRFARRVITRPSQVDAEDHDCLDEDGFRAAEVAGAFCLAWAAHGLRYGLPASLSEACADGATVIANVSRRIVERAAEHFVPLGVAVHVVEITAPHALLVERIAARGRETPAEIATRLARSVRLDIPRTATGHHAIDNSGAPDVAAMAFARLVRNLSRDPLPSI